MDNGAEQNALRERLHQAKIRANWLRTIALLLLAVFVLSFTEVNGEPVWPPYVPWLVLFLTVVFSM